MRPFAAASIGQVHRAKLAQASPLRDRYNGLEELAVKVQFPGVRQSITSDLGTLRWLLVASAALPRGLYLDNTLRVLGRELEDECDYLREAQCGRKMRDKIAASALADSFDVPEVVDELCGPMVLTTRMMTGRPLKDVFALDQATRDEVRSFAHFDESHIEFDRDADRHEGHAALHVRALRLPTHADRSELEQLPLQPSHTQGAHESILLEAARTPDILGMPQLELVDFGATREYSADFMRVYANLLDAAIAENRDEAIQLSQELGYLTGGEGAVRGSASLFRIRVSELTCSPADYGRRTPGVTFLPRDTIPRLSTVPVPVRDPGTTYYGSHPAADPNHAQASSQAAARGDVQPQSQAERRFPAVRATRQPCTRRQAVPGV